MSLGRRSFLGSVGAVGLAPYAVPTATAATTTAATPRGHEHFMAEAIEEGRKHERYPFGAVLVRDGRVVGRGVNAAQDGPTYHGEMVAIDDYGQPYGSPEWAGTALYTTAEPCPMCMSACAWAGIDQVLWGTSIEGLRRTGLDQIDLSATDVARAAESFYRPSLLLGGVLADRTDELFRHAQAVREGGA
ncbi:nucleoside deaminase [Kitasatospora sp. NPDC089509]|uniref:nucleoside deaminase n=1 Tax=Kitasatospora sp. NPDC089509 TaxID=3364079 RepID=UPI003827290F